MAIEIVYRGAPPADITYRGTCDTCKSVLQCKQADGTLRHGDQRDPGNWVDIVCPVCRSTAHCYPPAPPHYRLHDHL